MDIKTNDYKQCKCGKYYLNDDGEKTECSDCERKAIEEHEAWIRYKGKNTLSVLEEDLEKYVVGEIEILGRYEFKDKKYVIIKW
ncbi:MAG: hypothetical protein ACRC1T_09495 [Clostridium chrysemydis]|uniref:hypothetical protein n=1 Tax=Clostridium chrysemydis TaxID=2665504 RepID=UPI003F37083D